MNKNIHLLFLTVLIIDNNVGITNTLPRKAFIYIRKKTSISKCLEERCMAMNFYSSASGFTVKVINDGSFIVTAAHVCVDRAPAGVVADKVHSVYKVHRLDGKEYTANVLTYNIKNDVCLMFANSLVENIESVKISDLKPLPGEQVHNIAAPRGLFKPNAAPILDGRYNGMYNISDWYTLPAAPGSSGSMIINTSGKLVGMVHSVFINFPFMTLSTEYEYLKTFINKNVNKYIIYKNVMNVLDLKDIFSS